MARITSLVLLLSGSAGCDRPDLEDDWQLVEVTRWTGSESEDWTGRELGVADVDGDRVAEVLIGSPAPVRVPHPTRCSFRTPALHDRRRSAWKGV